MALTSREELEQMPPIGPLEMFELWRGDDGAAHFNFPQRIIYQSPTGMEYGYGGSGPADTALNILIHFVSGRRAFELHQEFKSHFIAPVPQNAKIHISRSAVEEWLDAQ